jgi:N-hydroxyarylamine O-acetyltransferase
MKSAIDLDAYLERIGYEGPRSPTLDTLRSIVLKHTEAIPFENLSPLVGWPVRLDAASLEQKIVKEGRGGYCFEQNLLLLSVLDTIGFQAHGLSARALWNQPEDAITSRSHMLLRVDLEGEPHIVDVGFGGVTLTGVMTLHADVEQATPHEPFRLARRGDDYFMQVYFAEKWNTLYRFDLQRQYLPDYEVSSWYLTHHPESLFVNALLAARADAGRRYALRDNELSIHHVGGDTEKRTLASATELRDVLIDEFRLTLPNTSQLDTVLARLCATAP